MIYTTPIPKIHHKTGAIRILLTIHMIENFPKKKRITGSVQKKALRVAPLISRKNSGMLSGRNSFIRLLHRIIPRVAPNERPKLASKKSESGEYIRNPQATKRRRLSVAIFLPELMAR
jgi:hypothetical protein